MEQAGADRVFLQDVMVPHWERGAKEEAYIVNGKQKITVPLLALGGSIATPKKGIQAEVIEVQNFQELRALGKENAKEKSFSSIAQWILLKLTRLKPTVVQATNVAVELMKPVKLALSV
jgi:glutaredoxin